MDITEGVRMVHIITKVEPAGMAYPVPVVKVKEELVVVVDDETTVALLSLTCSGLLVMVIPVAADGYCT